MLRCSECKKNIIQMTAYQHWVKLFNFFEFLHVQGDITAETYDSMTDSLTTFHTFANECEEKDHAS